MLTVLLLLLLLLILVLLMILVLVLLIILVLVSTLFTLEKLLLTSESILKVPESAKGDIIFVPKVVGPSLDTGEVVFFLFFLETRTLFLIEVPGWCGGK